MFIAKGLFLFNIRIIQFEFLTEVTCENRCFFEKMEIFLARNRFSIQEKIKNVVGRIGSFHGSQCPRMELLVLAR